LRMRWPIHRPSAGDGYTTVCHLTKCPLFQASPFGFISIGIFTFLCKAALEEELKKRRRRFFFFKYVSDMSLRAPWRLREKEKCSPTPQSVGHLLLLLFILLLVCVLFIYLLPPR